MSYELSTDTHETKRRFEKRDQFGPQLEYFSLCILEHEPPEPDGNEGLADVRIVRAIHTAAETGRAVEIEPVEQPRRPSLRQAMSRPGFDKPEEIRASGPSD